MKLLTIAVLLLTSAPPGAPGEAPGPAPKAPPQQRAPAFKDFEDRFRTAVLKKDVAAPEPFERREESGKVAGRPARS